MTATGKAWGENPPEDSGSLYPSAVRARSYKLWCDRRVLKSIGYLCGVVERATKAEFEDVRTRVSQALRDPLEHGVRLSSLVHLYHSNLRLAVEAQFPQGAVEALTALQRVPLFSRVTSSEPLGSRRWPEAKKGDIREALDRSSMITYGGAMGLEKPVPVASRRMRAAVSRALVGLASADPELHSELSEYVTDIVYYQSSKTTSGSSFNCLGLVSMNCISGKQNWTTALEMLVHEAAHQHVFSVMASDSLVLNEDAGLFRSTLRKDPRPLSGLFHAMVVVARLNYIAARLFRSGELERCGVKIVPARNNAGNRMPYRGKFEPLVSTIKKHAKLSPLGWRMVESSCELASLDVPPSAFA